MGLTKSLLDESYYHNSRHDILYDAEYEEFCHEQQKDANQKTQELHSGRGNQYEIGSTDSLHALRKQENNQE
jgi:hypothetical protein